MRLALLLPLLAGALGTASSTARAAPPQEGGGAPAKAPAVAPGKAADSPASRVERLRRARERWAKMLPEQRDRIRRRFEEWQRLPDERREVLRRRLEELGGPEGVGLAHRKLEDLRSRAPEHVARMRQQAENLQRLEARLVEGLPPPGRARYDRLSPEERERVRFRLGRALLEMGREQMLRAHASEEERRAIRDGAPEEARAARKAVYARLQQEVLEPHRRALEALPQEERRARKANLIEESFWRRVREERGGDIRAAFLRFLQENGAGAGRLLAMGKERFRTDFGVAPDELGDAPSARALLLAAFAVPPDRRDAFLAEIRPEVRRIVDTVPLDRRAAELRALLERK